MSEHTRPVQLCFDLSELVRTSVATLYSNLVTRPTGQAIRLGIEAQLFELGQSCLSVLDFSEVIILDFSCADEAVAKLICRYQRDADMPPVYFMARGLDNVHRETLEAVLCRHQLALPVQLGDRAAVLLGDTSPAEREVWSALEEMGTASLPELAGRLAGSATDVEECLGRLCHRRLIMADSGGRIYRAISSTLL